MTDQKSMTGQAWAELLLLAFLWGGSFLAFAVALREIDVFAVAAHRVTWAAILLWIIALVRGWPLPPRRLWLACLIMGILNNVIPFSLIAWGQLRVESGLASIYNASTALFAVPIAALVFADERMTPRKTIGVLLGFVGVVLAIGRESLQSFDFRALSQLAIIAASVSYALASCWARAKLRDLDTKSAALGMITGSAIVLTTLSLIFDGAPDLTLAPATWASISYIAIAATVLAYLVYYRVLEMAGAANLMLVTLLIPPVAIVLGAVVLDEALTMDAFVGLLVIALGMAILDGRLLSALSLSKPAHQGIEAETPPRVPPADDISDKT